jgi:hypothetical protein
VTEVLEYRRRQRNSLTRFAYSLSLGLGFSALACFCIGYVWLILRVAGLSVSLKIFLSETNRKGIIPPGWN